jgi:hypothetical protein
MIKQKDEIANTHVNQILEKDLPKANIKEII